MSSKVKQIIPLILCGGGGKRLWPLSRSETPKPFINLNDESLFQATLRRFNKKKIDHIVIIADLENEKIILDHLNQLKLKQNIHIILEPFKRNTGPAIFSAISYINDMISDDAIVNICPADHYINPDDYSEIMTQLPKISPHKITCYGIKPSCPNINYGYINCFNNKVTFKEKPDLETAKKFLKSKSYYWNSGIFSSHLSFILAEFASQTKLPKISYRLSKQIDSLRIYTIDSISYESMPNESFDYMIMENSKNIFMSKINFKWSDIGTWEGFDNFIEYSNDPDNNKHVGNALFYNSKNSSVISSTDKLIVSYGLSNISIIDAIDSLLVIDKKDSDKVSSLYDDISKIDKRLVSESQSVTRPWGKYEILISAEKFKVKKIILNPYSAISSQKHDLRNEHWIVVEGKITVHKDNQILFLDTNDSIKIQAKTKHKLLNETKKIAIIIEVQTGEYLGEDDIVRYD